MSFTLTMSGIIVGRSDLETRDVARRVAHGAFRPALGYDLVQPVFELFEGARGDAEALARYRRAREALRLVLTHPSGDAVTVRELHIMRRPGAAAGDAAYVMEIETDDPAVWRSTNQL